MPHRRPPFPKTARALARPASRLERRVVLLAGWLLLANALLLALVMPARAAVAEARADGFVSVNEAVMPTTPAQVWAALIDWPAWWNPQHSHSGEAGALRLDPQAGGALIERWPGGTVKHARVINGLPRQLLRLAGGFGPLQALPVNAILEFRIAPENGNTRLTMTYRVAGNPQSKLDTLAAPVDAMMSAGFDRLINFANTGKP